jgi:aminoglycoside phosphotransferase (APT) family kinase protein
VQQQRPAGVRTLKDAYTDPVLDIPSIGKRMGHWIASLHALTPPADLKDNAVARRLYGGSYRGCPGTLERFGLDPAPAQIALEKYEPLLQAENSYLCHGDFWTGNVLLPAGDDPSPRLTMVDWEMCRRGYGATDIGQFAAEAWLLDNHRDNRSLLPAFLEGYRNAAGPWVTEEFVKRAIVHCGVHLAYWPSMSGWADTDGTKKILEYGAQLIRGVEQGDIGWLKQSIFGPLLPS